MGNVSKAPHTPIVPPAALDDLELALAVAIRGGRDPEAMLLACESMDRRREQIFEREGLLDLAVPEIKALRNGA